MRITNEQAKADAICELYCPDCELANKMPENWQCTHGDIPTCRYAKDLLEARKLIKDMRETIKHLKEDFQPAYHDCVDDGLDQCAWCDADDILEKTKDYV